MKGWKAFVLAWLLVFLVALAGAALFIHRGFRATNQPSRLEATLARAARDFSIPNAARHETNPLDSSPKILNESREAFLARCQTCHGHDGSGSTAMGQSLYPRAQTFAQRQHRN